MICVQSTVGSLLLVVSCVVLTCVVVSYAVGVFEVTLGTSDIPQLDRVRRLEQALLNATDTLLNEDLPEVAESSPSP